MVAKRHPTRGTINCKLRTAHRDKATERLVKNLEMDIKKKKREAYIDPAKALEEKEKGNVKFREG